MVKRFYKKSKNWSRRIFHSFIVISTDVIFLHWHIKLTYLTYLVTFHMYSCDWKQLINVSIASSDHVFKFSFFLFTTFFTLHNNFFLMNMVLFKFCVHVLFVFVNSIRFVTCLNQMSCNRGKTDSETKKLKTKCFFQQKCFWSEAKAFACFSGVSFAENHEGNKWRYTKSLIKNKFLFCFSRFARALQ